MNNSLLLNYSSEGEEESEAEEEVLRAASLLINKGPREPKYPLPHLWLRERWRELRSHGA